MAVQQSKLTLTHTRGIQLVSLLDLCSELQPVLLKLTQPLHVHQRESHDLEITTRVITLGSVQNGLTLTLMLMKLIMK